MYRYTIILFCVQNFFGVLLRKLFFNQNFYLIMKIKEKEENKCHLNGPMQTFVFFTKPILGLNNLCEKTGT